MHLVRIALIKLIYFVPLFKVKTEINSVESSSVCLVLDETLEMDGIS